MAVIAAVVVALAAGTLQSSAGTFKGAETPSGKVSGVCGAAIDSAGDVYIASAGTASIDVFAADGRYLSSISNAKRPCALAVDSKGNLYALESASGEVVKYGAETYPFKGSPSYSGPTTIDINGKATGIAVDPVKNQFYVAEDGHVDAYNPDGTLGEDAVQRVFPFETKGGTFTLSFEGEKTGPLPYNISNAGLEGALSRLPAIGSGNVSVTQGPSGKGDHLVTFTGQLSNTPVGAMSGNKSKLIWSGELEKLLLEVFNPGFSGRVGEALRGVSSLATYTYGRSTRYLFVASSSGGSDRIDVFAGSNVTDFRRLATIDGAETPNKSIGFGSGSAVIGVNERTGHLFVYDARHSVIDEFEATGTYVDSIRLRSLGGLQPAAITSAPRPNHGSTFVAKRGTHRGSVVQSLPIAPRARHSLLRRLSAMVGRTLPHGLQSYQAFQAQGSCGTTVDSHGYIYVSANRTITIYDPQGHRLTRIVDPRRPCDLAVDSEGNVYAITLGKVGEGDERLVLYRASSYPPSAATHYNKPKTLFSYEGRGWVAVDPRNDHLLASFNRSISGTAASLFEYDSARDGSRLISNKIGAGLLEGTGTYDGGLDVCGRNGDIYAAGRGEGGWRIYVLSPGGARLLTAIDGSGSPGGIFVNHSLNIAVDQSDCHVFVADYNRPVEEYEASGTFVSKFGPAFTEGDVTVDNSPISQNRGDVYLMPQDRWLAFGPLSGLP